MMHETVGGQVQVLNADHVGEGEELLNLIVGEAEVGEQGLVMEEGEVGQIVVRQVQMSQVSQLLQTSGVADLNNLINQCS